MRTADWNTSSSVLERAASILGAFRIEDRTLGVSELARRTGLAKSTVARLAAELVRLQYLERHGSSLRLGLALFELGQLAATPKELRRRAIGIMADLRNATGQTIHLAVLDGTEVVYIEILRGRGTPQLPSRVGGRLPAHATAVGKAMLAFSPPQVLEDVIATGLPPVGPGTITDEKSLRRELADIAATGLAYERNESAMGSCCVASPVMDAGGALVASLSVSGKTGQLDIDRVAPAVRTATLALGRQLPRNSALAGN
ncbi:IclR family transcriptional regulator [Arthrobacter mobilis]|uniref:IclR family transcriptional regulator n=1 Tax=Arthrobacter mobilis TaxID=2724944 RepID=A0A7X6HEH9_9MICC|nr:IclR family transcriptional regulator [Arthrobacter mobilis]NKX55586.1 IclR family transcriptional regulator [Arthrobacter mobilis]